MNLQDRECSYLSYTSPDTQNMSCIVLETHFRFGSAWIAELDRAVLLRASRCVAISARSDAVLNNLKTCPHPKKKI
jgi:hypothetical protein